MRFLLFLIVAAVGARPGHAQVSPAECLAGSYYNGVDLELTGSALRRALHNLVDNHVVLPYTSSRTDTWDAINDLDEQSSSRVELVYSSFSHLKSGQGSAYNREHLWPRSRLLGSSGADQTDIHALRACDARVNSSRGNKVFDKCTSRDCYTPSNTAPGTLADTDVWQPPPEDRGDIARALFYMSVRYDGSDQATDDLSNALTSCSTSNNNLMGNLNTLLQWHVDDPPDAAEVRRNGRACGFFQGNRNPFIDHPELANRLFFGYRDPVFGCKVVLPPGGDDGGGGDGGDGGEITTGSLLIVSLNSDSPKSLQLVATEKINGGQEIKVTDNGWTGSGWRATEGIIKYTVPSAGLSSGEIISWVDGAWGSSWTESGNFLPSSSGEQIFVYTGDSTFVTGFNYRSTRWDASSTSSTSSALPSGLSGFALALSHRDNYRYTGSLSGGKRDLLDRILDPTQWSGSNSQRVQDSPPDDVGEGSSAVVWGAALAGVAFVLLGALLVTRARRHQPPVAEELAAKQNIEDML